MTEEFEEVFAREMAKAKDEFSRDPKVKKSKKRVIEELTGKLDFLENANFTGLGLMISDDPVHLVTSDDFIRRGREKIRTPLKDSTKDGK